MSTQPCKPATSAPDAHVEIGVEGYYNLRITKAGPDGNPLESTAREIEFPNLITNFGMDSIGSVVDATADRWWDSCVVGSGTTPPAFTDTTLASLVAATSTVLVDQSVSRQVVTSPRWVEVSRTWRFAVGAAAGNLTEVGVRRGTGTPQNLYSRALIVDAGGNPTSITVLSDEFLDVTYRLRYFIPENDVTGSVTLKGTNYNWTLRPVSIQQSASFGSNTGWPSIASGNFGVRAGVVQNNTVAVSSTAIGTPAMVAMDQTPTLSGVTNQAASSLSAGTYVTGQYFLDSVCTWGLTSGNNAAIQLATFTCGFGSFQLGFSPAFSKLNTDQLRLTFRVTWARR